MNYIYDNKNKTLYKEKVPKILTFFYTTLLGRILLKLVITKPITSLSEIIMNSKLSRLKINRFVKKNGINIDEYENVKYNSFNEFFTRKIKKDKRKIISDKKTLVSPADSKLSIYKIDKNEKIRIKNSIYTVEELTKDNTYKEYVNGYALVFRLSVDDYHHYIFIDDGKVIKTKKIDGKFHTVNKLALKKYKVYSENSREVTYLNTKHFDKIVYIEVGALMVGKIVNNYITKFKRGQEKGYFCFGGSTIVILFKENSIEIDESILNYTNKDIEVKLKLGEVIGKKVGN